MNGLDPEKFSKMRSSGAFLIACAQLSSKSHLDRLLERAQLGGIDPTVLPREIDGILGQDDGTRLNFGCLLNEIHKQTAK